MFVRSVEFIRDMVLSHAYGQSSTPLSRIIKMQFIVHAHNRNDKMSARWCELWVRPGSAQFSVSQLAESHWMCVHTFCVSFFLRGRVRPHARDTHHSTHFKWHFSGSSSIQRDTRLGPSLAGVGKTTFCNHPSERREKPLSRLILFDLYPKSAQFARRISQPPLFHKKTGFTIC